jgi:cell division protein YceG involved in septum cleavage
MPRPSRVPPRKSGGSRLRTTASRPSSSASRAASTAVPTDLTAGVQSFASQLGARTGLPVALQDERLTSVEAESRLAERDKDWRSRKKRLDAAGGRHHPCRTIWTGCRGEALLSERAAVLLVVGLAAAGGGGYLLWTRMHEPFQGFEGEQFVEIPTGDGSRAIARRLADAGVVPDSWTFRAAVRWLGRGQTLQAGEYRFADAASPLDVVERLARGDVYTIAITFPEGLTIDEMAGVFESRGLGTAQAFRDAARDVSAIAPWIPRRATSRAISFPKPTRCRVRRMPRRWSGTMVERFKSVYAELTAAGVATDLTTRQVVTLASLVEKETARAEERPVVAAVYRNRMAIGMGMQAIQR